LCYFCCYYSVTDWLIDWLIDWLFYWHFCLMWIRCSLDFVVNRFFMKMFGTNNINFVRDMQFLFGFSLPSELWVTGWQGGPKISHHFFCMPSLYQILTDFQNYFSQNQEKICNNTFTKDPTTPQVCLYTTLWNVSVLKATMIMHKTSVMDNCHYWPEYREWK